MEATREENEKTKMTVGGLRRRGGGGKTNVEDGERIGKAGREWRGEAGGGRIIMEVGREGKGKNQVQ